MWFGTIVRRMAGSLALLVGLASGVAAAEITIRMGTTDPLETPYGRAVVEFKRLVETGSNGRIEVQLFPSNQLGDIVEQIENVRQGSQQMSISTPAWFSRFYPAIDVLEMPFLVTDWDQVRKLVASKPFRDLSAAATQESRVMVFGVLPYGFRNVINNRRPIRTLEDFRGLKLRLQNSPVHLATFRALGANPVSISWNETYQAVQTGVVDGLENSNVFLLGPKFYEVAKYVSITRHFFGMLLVYINPAFFDGLSAADKELLTRSMREAEAMNFRLSFEAEEAATEGLRAAGASVNTLSPETMAAMRAAVRPVYETFGGKFGTRLADLQRAVQD